MTNRTAGGLRVIVLGYVVRGPLGGMAWHHLQYVIGLAQLGHDVHFLEDSDDFPSCYDPTRLTTGADPSYGLRFAENTFARLGFGDRWAYYDAHTARWLGPAAGRVADVCATADILINVSGVNPLRSWLMEIPCRVLIDTDPAFTQIRHLTNPAAHTRAAAHTAFFSFGENIESGESSIPDDGFPWKATRQPIVLDAWPVTTGPAKGRFTTVMAWESYEGLDYDGRRYGLKSDSFEGYLDVPQRATAKFELAVGAPSEAKQMLRDHGWKVCNPLILARDPWSYQAYIQRSKAEFSVAKQGYVVSRSGWFSERSAAYLASARPVVTQDTGFSRQLPTGEGLFSFATSDEAVAAVQAVSDRYELHCKAARALAEDYFDARTLLGRMIEQANA